MADAASRDTSPRLAGVRVLVTRPRHQSAALAALIEAHGGTAIRFPVMEILPAREPQAARAVMAQLDDFSLVIFISRNAVEQGLALVKGVPRQARIAAVGGGSAAALEQAGFKNVLRPSDAASSEALLALPELSADAVAGSRVLIVRGEGGRELLGGTLSKRGARVTYAEVYRRAKPQGDAGEVAERGRTGGIDAIVVTSVQGLENLFEMLGEGDTEWLESVGYVVISERLVSRARDLGVRGEPVVAARADDEALVEALVHWHAGRADEGA